MSHTFIPEGYKPRLSLYETQAAISLIKRKFQDGLALALNLKRVSAPLFVDPSTGLNDDLNGVERPVSFDIPDAGLDAQVVQSLAKWKRMALYRYDVHPGKGIYADMNAIRRDEELDNLHSIYVDQWDWERVITPETRNLHTLKETVRSIVECIYDASLIVNGRYPQLQTQLPSEVTFITTQELLELYPTLTPKQRENAFVREHPVTFLMQIGGVLSNGEPHDGRAPDYDDWTMNGDILFYNPVLDCSFEISSMGIRVDSKRLDEQLRLAHCDNRRNLLFHKMLLEGKLPLTMGGGIGQSRLCMLLLGKAHIGEVQSSIWDEETHRVSHEAGLTLL
ncbi:MAG: aspartate--ammonia ligase [Eubacteriales bacterium]|nr:aspartate--ammonia ligase [Eubacteriales bacterium]